MEHDMQHDSDAGHGHYYYEPAQGHGLPHDPFKSILGPRPIGWISTVCSDGVPNLAPYSFFSAFANTPPVIGFSSEGRKDTLRNIEATGEFVWNLASRELADAMNASSAPVAPGVDEFALAGLAPAASHRVRAPRVAAAPVALECWLTQIVAINDTKGGFVGNWLVLGQVVGVHISRHLLQDGIYDTAAAAPILRGGGPGDYFVIEAGQRFQLRRPGA